MYKVTIDNQWYKVFASEKEARLFGNKIFRRCKLKGTHVVFVVDQLTK